MGIRITKWSIRISAHLSYSTGTEQTEYVGIDMEDNILSNKNWMIMGVNHQIKEGSYTTTLKLFLAVPGQQDEPGTTLGGNCGSVSFDNDRSPQADE